MALRDRCLHAPDHPGDKKCEEYDENQRCIFLEHRLSPEDLAPLYPTLVETEGSITWNGDCLNLFTASSTSTMKGANMKIMDKVELVVQLKERIEKAKKENLALAEQLQKLLENILHSKSYKAI